MPKIWWITKDGLPLPNGRIVADTYEEADKIMFYRMLRGQCASGVTIEEEDTPEQIEDSDIISVE